MWAEGSIARWAAAITLVATLLGVQVAVAGAASAGSGNVAHRYPQAGAVLAGPTRVHRAAYPDVGVLTFGDATFEGAPTGTPLNSPIVGMAATPDGKGYWLVAADGGVFAFGDAQFYGSTGAINLDEPIVGMAPTRDGRGYWLVASDGGVFTFGDGEFYGSTGGMTLDSPIVGMARTADGLGYWLVGGDGGIFTFGDAVFHGSEGGQPLEASVAGMAATPTGLGYWLVGNDGSVYRFGDAADQGSNAAVTPTQPVAQIVATPSGAGYWMLEPDAFTVAFSHPGGGSPIVTVAAGQVVGDPDTGSFCNPYGPCEAWCALFATWVWETAGIPIPHYAFVGDVYTWAAAHTAVRSASQLAAPGDAILYGTGPWNVDTAVHMGIVGQVWPDGAVDTIEGDAGPGAYGHYNVIINGPFLPTHSATYNGVPVFGIAVP